MAGNQVQNLVLGTTRFSIGEILLIKKTGVRAVVVEVDPHFRGSASWFEELGISPQLKSTPWYQLLIENGDEVVYMPEGHLETSEELEPINNPNLLSHFQNYENGRYHKLFH